MTSADAPITAVVLGLLWAVSVGLWPSRPRPDVDRQGGWGWRAVGWVRPYVRRARRAGRRVDGPTPGEVADTLVLLAMAVRSGLGLTEALAQVAECTTGPVRRDLAAVVAALRWGRPTSQAWAFAGAPWRPAALAWTVSERTGAPPGDLLERAAERSRHAEDRAAEQRAARAGVLLVLPLGFGFLPAFACTAVIPLVLALARGVLRS